MAEGEHLRSVRFAPFAQPVPKSGKAALVPEGAADPPADDDLPPIEQFLDELPSIDDYLADSNPEPVAVPDAPEAIVPVDHGDREGWAFAGWQLYDWSGLAALATPASRRESAGSPSSRTQWPNMDPEHDAKVDSLSANSTGAASAEEVAMVLDDLAYRIRSGQLPIDQFTNQPPEAAMAAALAAMLRDRG